ncbi:MAG: hypothetical protein SNJ75_07240 [Gemmataceae bacterium]
MKAEEREALATNELAKGLETVAETVTHPPKTALYWGLGLGVVAIVVLLFLFFLWSANAASSARWVALSEAAFPEQLALLDAEGTLKDTAQGRLLEFKEARLALAEGMRMLGINRNNAGKSLQRAVEKYESLMKSAGKIPLLHQEALAGAARANEALGELDKAKKLYAQLADSYKNTALGEDAKKQLARLERDAAQINELKKELSPNP